MQFNILINGINRIFQIYLIGFRFSLFDFLSFPFSTLNPVEAFMADYLPLWS